MKDAERVEQALHSLDSATRRDVIGALEGLAFAVEMIPTGSGAPDVAVTRSKCDSRPPADIHLFAAEVLREGRRSLRSIALHAARLRCRSEGMPDPSRPPAGKMGRPTVITGAMVERAKRLRATKHSVTSTVRLIALEFGCAESTVWKSKERGEAEGASGIDLGFAQALRPR